MDVLEARIRMTVVGAVGMALVALVFGLGCVPLAGWMAWTGLVWQAALMLLFSGMMALTVWAFTDTARTHTPAKKSPIYLAYEARPSTVGWVYRKVGRSNGFHVALLDGTELTLSAGQKHCDALFALTRQVAPDAIFGYGAAQEQAWRARRAAIRGG